MESLSILGRRSISGLLFLAFLAFAYGNLDVLIAITGTTLMPRSDLILSGLVGATPLILSALILDARAVRWRGFLHVLVIIYFVIVSLALKAQLYKGREIWSFAHLLLLNVIFGGAIIGTWIVSISQRLFVKSISNTSLTRNRRVTVGIFSCAVLVFTCLELALSLRVEGLMLEGLSSVTDRERIAAARVLSRSGVCESRAISALSDTDYRVRRDVAIALGRSACKEALHALEMTLLDENPGVRVATLFAFNTIWSRWQVPLPIEKMAILLFHDGPYAGQEEAALLLADAGGANAVEALMHCLQDRNLAVVTAAHEYFIARGSPGSESVLAEALNRHGDLRMALALLHSGNPVLVGAAQHWMSSAQLEAERFHDYRLTPMRWGSERGPEANLAP